MELNKLQIKGQHIILKVEKPLIDPIIKEFTDYTLDMDSSGCLYEFKIMPNQCFSLRAMIAKYAKVFKADRDVLIALSEKTKYATMPIVSLHSGGKHVQIECPPLSYYLGIVSAVGASNKGMNTYTVPIARAFDVIRAIKNNSSYLPSFIIAQSLRDELAEPIEGFDGSIASLFSSSISNLHGANSAYRVPLENFKNVGYNSIADFLITQPRRYIDKTKITSFENLEVKDPVNVIGKIVSKKVIFYKHASFDVQVGNAVFECIFYQRSWMEGKFSIGDEVLLMGEYQGRGKVGGQSMESLVEAQALDIVPIYPQSAKNKITSKVVLNVVYEAIEKIRPHIHKLAPYIDPNEMPMSLGKAINEMHFPTSSESYVEALETLALYEMIYLQLMIIERKSVEVKDLGIPKPKRANGYFDAMVNHLPWKLTEAQNEGLVEMDKYMSTVTAEQILLSADVGSGKSVIAQLSCMQALDNGYQSVLAAPTEVLAIQLHETFKNAIELMPEEKRPTIAFLGGKIKAKEKRELLANVKSGDIDVLVGTHSVLNSNIEFKNLGLVVIDEQQKFGRSQREALLETRGDGLKPDLLSQTATPIPRSTAQAFYGDIDLISLRGKPKGRIEIVTKWVKDDPRKITKNKSHEVWKDLTEEVNKGNQVFIVVPMVHESKKMDSASVEGAYKDLTKILKGVKVGFTHGSLKKADQHEAMEQFRNGELDVLVASTVIEVGVDVPNATRMVVLSADRLGASSLHQVRGRVGRSNLESTCYLISEGKTATSQKRLQALVDSTDGFEIAKVDLETRGQGDLFGERQAGDSALRFSNLVDHSKLVGKARSIAEAIYEGENKDLAIRDAKAILGNEEEI